jgi:Spy/CpxP family protein refolding chaperone
MNGLGLSPDQMKRVDAFHKQFGPKMQALERELGEKRRALETLYAQYSLDTAQAQKLNTEINHIQKQILEGHLKLQQDLRKILTSEQFDKLKSGMLRHRQGFGRPPGEGQPPHQH